MNLENRGLAEQDPRGFLANFPNGAFFDEAQHVPLIFSYLQQVVDENNVHFVLSGSQDFLLLEKITQSLAGRVAILRLLPFSQAELSKTKHKFKDVEQAIFQGGYPRIYDKKIVPRDYYPPYMATYIEKDIRQLRDIGNLSAFTNFMKLCAGRTGQLLNVQSLVIDAGISPNSAKAWLSVLEAGYIIHRLTPHHNNFHKWLIKSPKLYFYDKGPACSLLGIETSDHN